MITFHFIVIVAASVMVLLGTWDAAAAEDTGAPSAGASENLVTASIVLTRISGLLSALAHGWLDRH